MTQSQALEKIRQAVAKVASRIRLQSAIEGLTTGGTLGLLLGILALVLFKTGWITETAFWIIVGNGVVVALGFAFYGFRKKLDEIALAQKLDAHHGLHDRLSTALSLDNAKVDQTWRDGQLRDAAKYVSDLDVSNAAPYKKPLDITPFVVVALAFVAVLVLKAPDHQHPLPQPPSLEHAQILDSATIALERDRLIELKKELEKLDDDASKELVEDLEELLEQVEQRELSEKQFLEKLKKIEKKFDEAVKEPSGAEDLAEALKKAAEKLEKEAGKDLKKEKEVKELVEALKKKDLKKASKALSAIAEKLLDKDMDQKDLERLARLMEKFSLNIDVDDPMIQKLMKKHQKTLDKLSKKMNKDGKLSKKEQEMLKKAQDKMKELNKKQQANSKKKSTRELEKIKRKTKEISENAKKIKKGKGKKKNNSEEKAPEDNYKKEAGRKAKDASEQMDKQGKQQKKDAARQMAKKQLEELKEAMQRSSKSQDKQGQQTAEKRGKQMKEFLDRAKGKAKSAKMKGGKGEGEKGQKLESDPNKETPQSDIAGKGQGDRKLGSETDIDSKTRDEKVKAKEGKGPTSAEVIKSGSEEGFASTDYKDVYENYESVVEEVMEKERVPKGYRYYVKKYFQLIQPRE